MIKMPKYAIFAGMGGSMGGAQFQGVYEYNDLADAEQDAYMKAEEEYQSYEGSHGIPSWDDCYEDALESEWIDSSTPQNEVDSIVDDMYLESLESWVHYYVREVSDDCPETVSEEEVENYFVPCKQ